VSGAPCDNNIMIWHAVIFGPHDTPFEDGTFKLAIRKNKTRGPFLLLESILYYSVLESPHMTMNYNGNSCQFFIQSLLRSTRTSPPLSSSTPRCSTLTCTLTAASASTSCRTVGLPLTTSPPSSPPSSPYSTNRTQTRPRTRSPRSSTRRTGKRFTRYLV
jgi:hypothetical protein